MSKKILDIIFGAGDPRWQQEILTKLEVLEAQGEKLMAKFEEVEQELKDIQAGVDAIPGVIAAETAEVSAKITAQTEEIKKLKDQLAAGSPVTQEQLDSLAKQSAGIKTAVAGIGTAVSAIFTDEGGGPTP